MRILYSLLLLPLLCHCSKDASPGESTTPVPQEASYQERCGAFQAKIEGLYRQAAAEEEVPVHLEQEFISANTHMVLEDCLKNPVLFTPCLENAQSSKEIESQCLITIDDEGRSEEAQFTQ